MESCCFFFASQLRSHMQTGLSMFYYWFWKIKSRIIWTKIEKRSLNQIWTFSGPLWEFFYPIQWSMHKIWVLWRVLIYQNPFRKHIFWPLCSNLKKVGLIWNKGGYARFRLPLSTCLCMCTQVGSWLSTPKTTNMKRKQFYVQ